MPMRGTLPLRNSALDTFRETMSAEEVVLLLLNTRDFTIIASLAAAGILASLWFALKYPGTIELMAMFGQTT
jgi:hypothetical protein